MVALQPSILYILYCGVIIKHGSGCAAFHRLYRLQHVPACVACCKVCLLLPHAQVCLHERVLMPLCNPQAEDNVHPHHSASACLPHIPATAKCCQQLVPPHAYAGSTQQCESV